jgi:L-ascorbate metabolism protein UlaG (beta-lactamase superfamily)
MMKLTKYAHACVVLEEQGKKVVIDPGEWTPEFGDASNVAAVVVTHVHQDHFSPKNLEAIIAANPDVPVFTTTEVAEQFKQPNVKVVQAGQSETVEPFTLRFGGEMHAAIHEYVPVPHNTSVFVNDAFYYPGDSYTMPDKPVKVLAVPANAPWMKVADSMDFIAKIKPERCFLVHDELLSDRGRMVYGFGLSKACEENGVELQQLAPGESLDIE